MSEDRLIELETRFAYQEAALHSLSDTLAEQHARIERLERTCRHLLDRLPTAGDGAEKASARDEVPPHY